MVGKIHVISPNVCCERIFTIMKKRYPCNPNMQSSKSLLPKIISRNPFTVLFFALFCFLVFVLYITNIKPDTYKHENAESFTENNIHDEHNSVFHYAVVIDCGSSGSRVYIYYWPPHTGDKEELLQIKQMIDIDGNPVRLKIKPGISSYADNPENASHSLQPLIQFASDHIPHTKHVETPLYILATAGMRLLSNEKQAAILKNLKTEVPTFSKLYFAESQLEVISGKQEGIYLWIATNYILGRFDHSHDVGTTPAGTVAHLKRKQTGGTIEIGGASLQIAYEVPQNVTIPAELGATINLGCDVHNTIHEYQIYVTTFLGYGTDAARKSYVRHMFDNNKETIKAHETLIDPCLPKDLVDEQLMNETKFKMTGTGEFDRCTNLLIANIESKKRDCAKPPCSLNGVYQPTVHYSNAEFFGFAEFWYSSNDVLRLGGRYSHSKLLKAAKNFCEIRWSLHKRHYAMGLYPKADNFRFRYQCFKSAWVTSVLHSGLNFPYDYDGLTTVQMIRGKEVQWTLGALLYQTRFMPLRDMKVEGVQSLKAHHHGIWLLVYSAYYPILFVCASIAVIFIISYCRRIRKFSRSPVFYTMSRGSANYQALPNKYELAYDVRIKL